MSEAFKNYLIALILVIFFGSLAYRARDNCIRPSGNYWMDSQALIAARHFAVDGFKACRFTSIVNAGEITEKPEIYSNFSNLNIIIYGILWRLGVDQIWFYRIIVSLLSTLSLFCFYLIVLNVLREKSVAFISMVLLGVNHQFYYYSDDIWLGPYSFFFALLPIAIFLLLINAKNKKRSKWHLILWPILFIQILITYDVVVYTFLFIGLYLLLFSKLSKENFKNFALLCTAPIVGFIIILIKNKLALGVFNINLNLLLNNSFIGVSKMDFWRTIFYLFQPSQLIYYLVFLGVFIGIVMTKNKKIMIGNKTLKLVFILMSCGLTWFLLFPQHALHHAAYYVRFFIPPIAVLTAVVLLLNVKNKKLLKLRLSTVLLILIVSVNLFSTLRRDLYNKDFDLKEYSRLREFVPSDSVIFSSIKNYPLAFYTNRKVVEISDSEELTNFIKTHNHNLMKRRKFYVHIEEEFLINPALFIAADTIRILLIPLDWFSTNSQSNQFWVKWTDQISKRIDKSQRVLEGFKMQLKRINKLESLGLILYELN